MAHVDPPRDWKRNGRKWSHLMADTLEELHTFAEGIGVKRCWFEHKRGGWPHYDLNEKQYELAVLHGAVVIPTRELLVRYAHQRKR